MAQHLNSQELKPNLRMLIDRLDSISSRFGFHRSSVSRKTVKSQKITKSHVRKSTQNFKIVGNVMRAFNVNLPLDRLRTRPKFTTKSFENTKRSRNICIYRIFWQSRRRNVVWGWNLFDNLRNWKFYWTWQAISLTVHELHSHCGLRS